MWAVEVRNADGDQWRRVYVDQLTSKVVGSANLVSFASYQAVSITSQDPKGGEQQIQDPQDKVASPSGWHNLGSQSSTTLEYDPHPAYQPCANHQEQRGKRKVSGPTGSRPESVLNIKACVAINPFL